MFGCIPSRLEHRLRRAIPSRIRARARTAYVAQRSFVVLAERAERLWFAARTSVVRYAVSASRTIERPSVGPPGLRKVSGLLLPSVARFVASRAVFSPVRLFLRTRNSLRVRDEAPSASPRRNQGARQYWVGTRLHVFRCMPDRPRIPRTDHIATSVFSCVPCTWGNADASHPRDERRNPCRRRFRRADACGFVAWRSRR